jgi:hypothetical protein
MFINGELVIDRDEVDSIVAVVAVELPIVWVVSVCIAEEALVIVSGDVPVCAED